MQRRRWRCRANGRFTTPRDTDDHPSASQPAFCSGTTSRRRAYGVTATSSAATPTTLNTRRRL
jgi:hypothetical protein